MRATTAAILEKVLSLVAQTTDGATGDLLAHKLKMDERTVRRYLATLFKDGALKREGIYLGDPPVFHYRYTVARPVAKPSAKAKPPKAPSKRKAPK